MSLEAELRHGLIHLHEAYEFMRLTTPVAPRTKPEPVLHYTCIDMSQLHMCSACDRLIHITERWCSTSCFYAEDGYPDDDYIEEDDDDDL